MEEQGLFTSLGLGAAGDKLELKTSGLAPPCLLLTVGISNQSQLTCFQHISNRTESNPGIPNRPISEPSRTESRMSIRTGASHGLTAHFAARGGFDSQVVPVLWCRGLLSWPGHIGGLTLVTCPCFWNWPQFQPHGARKLIWSQRLRVAPRSSQSHHGCA